MGSLPRDSVSAIHEAMSSEGDILPSGLVQVGAIFPFVRSTVHYSVRKNQYEP